jgi:hypothetical protein
MFIQSIIDKQRVKIEIELDQLKGKVFPSHYKFVGVYFSEIEKSGIKSGYPGRGK